MTSFSNYSQRRRPKTSLDNKRSASAFCERSLMARTGVVVPPRSEESKLELSTKLQDILKTENEYENEEQRKINSRQFLKKTDEEIQFHTFIDDFAITGKYLNERFEELYNQSKNTLEDLKKTKERLVECERSTYRTTMGLEEKYEEVMEMERKRKEREEENKRLNLERQKSFFTTSVTHF